MNQTLLTLVLTLFTLWSYLADAQTATPRLKKEEGYTRQGSIFVKTDSTYFEYPNLYVGDVWGNDFSEMHSFGRDSAQQSFEDNSYKSVFEYDANMRELSRTYYYYLNNAWNFDYKWQNTYNSQGQVTQYSRMGMVSGNLIEDYRITHTYNSNGHLVQRLEQKVSNGTATNDYNKLYTRDASGNMTDYVYQKWTNNAWLNDRRTVSTFKPTTNLADTVVRFDWVNNSWRSLSRDISEYNNAGLLTEVIKQSFNTNTQSFGNYLRETKAYNANNKLILYSFYTWISGNWRQDREISYQTYTGDFYGRATAKLQNYNTMQLENEYRYDNVFNQDGWRIKERTSKWINNNWVEEQYRDYTFETKQTTDINELKASITIGAYPNPFITNTIIEFDLSANQEGQISIYSINGQLVFNAIQMFSSGKNILLWNAEKENGEVLPAGLYLVQIKSQAGTSNFKLIKQ